MLISPEPIRQIWVYEVLQRPRGKELTGSSARSWSRISDDSLHVGSSHPGSKAGSLPLAVDCAWRDHPVRSCGNILRYWVALTQGCPTNAHPNGKSMSEHVYKSVELTGSSKKSSDDAVRNAISRAAETLHNLRWFEVTQVRGHLENGEITHWQVTMKVNFTLDEST